MAKSGTTRILPNNRPKPVNVPIGMGTSAPRKPGKPKPMRHQRDGENAPAKPSK